ncbi:MAG: alanine racemase [Acidobacteriota bacterium]|nr:alanine racemase [Acidobacteriota bacterium]
MGTNTLPVVGIKDYETGRAERVLTPALLVYADFVRQNIETTIRLAGGDAKRWRPHLKTTKLAWIVRELVGRGVGDFKCANTLELLTAASNGARDALVAYPVAGANAERVRQIAGNFPAVAVSTLVESPRAVAEWAGGNVGLFIDVNPGMNRTGIDQERIAEIVELGKLIRRAKIPFRGLHYYDGHLASLSLDQRTSVAHRGYDQLMKLVAGLEAASVPVECVITAGTPAFPSSLSYEGFRAARFNHQVSPGTLVFNDTTSLGQLPPEWGYCPAALVLSRVVSRPTANIVTCDAGHKTVSADAGIPNCLVLGHENLRPLKPSEEHLPIEVPEGVEAPSLGEFLYLLPKHICPTVNNFDHALIVEQGKITRLDRVAARGRENPLILSVRNPSA